MERTGTVTILFTDIVDSTRSLQRLGDRRWESVRRAHFGVLRRLLADHNGTEVKNTGDGLMAVFHSAVDAVEAGLAMQQAVRLPVAEGEVVHLRVGIATGEATTERGDYFGTPVVEAARLCNLAASGEVLASTFVRLLAGPHEVAVFEDLGPVELKGFAEPVQVFRVVARADAPTSAFRSPDAQPGGGAKLVPELDYWESLPSIRRMRYEALALLAPLPGDVVADLGCGPGTELVRLARIVGPEGRAIGVEISAAMLDEARHRAEAADVTVELHEADGRTTGLPDASVDAVRIERVIQHVGDVDAFVTEAMRIVRPGGRVVLIDTDWGSLVMHPGDPDVIRRLKGALEDGALVNPRAGRDLHAAAVRGGLVDVVSSAHAISVDEQADAGLDPMLRRVADAGVLSEAEYQAQRATGLAALADGSFVYAFLMFVVAGRRPASPAP